MLSHLAFEIFKIGPLDQKLIRLTDWRKIWSLFCFLVLDQSADFWQARVELTAESLDRMCMVTEVPMGSVMPIVEFQRSVILSSI